MSVAAMGWVWENSPLTGAQLVVHLAIADVVNDTHENELWMSLANIASKARVARSTVSETIAELCRQSLLERLSSGKNEGRPSRYRFLMPRPESGQHRSGGDRSGPGRVTGERSQNSISNNSINSSVPGRPVSGHPGPGEYLTHCTGCGHITLNCTCGQSVDDSVPPPWVTAGTSRDEWMRAQNTDATEDVAT